MTEQTIPALAKLDETKRDDYLRPYREMDEAGDTPPSDRDWIEPDTIRDMVNELGNTFHIADGFEGAGVSVFLECDPTDDYAALSISFGSPEWPMVASHGQRLRHWIGEDVSSWEAVATNVAQEVIDWTNETFARTIKMARDLTERFPA